MWRAGKSGEMYGHMLERARAREHRLSESNQFSTASMAVCGETRVRCGTCDVLHRCVSHAARPVVVVFARVTISFGSDLGCVGSGIRRKLGLIESQRSGTQTRCVC